MNRTIDIAERGIVKKQSLRINTDLVVIYGYNNSGKTSILKAIEESLLHKAYRSILREENPERFFFIPTDRLVLSSVRTEYKKINGIEQFYLNNQSNKADMRTYLKMIRDHYTSNDNISNNNTRFLLANIIKELFYVDIEDWEAKNELLIDNFFKKLSKINGKNTN